LVAVFAVLANQKPPHLKPAAMTQPSDVTLTLDGLAEESAFDPTTNTSKGEKMPA
jgi:hypothetical protein